MAVLTRRGSGLGVQRLVLHLLVPACETPEIFLAGFPRLHQRGIEIRGILPRDLDDQVGLGNIPLVRRSKTFDTIGSRRPWPQCFFQVTPRLV